MIGAVVDSGFRVVAPDLVGFGRSDKPLDHASYSYAAQAAWMRQWIEALDLMNIVLACQDWGSLIGLRLVADMPDPDIIEDRDVIVEVKACSICGSDLHIFTGDTFTDDVGYCVGHEAAGEIVAVGKGVRHRKVGDRVMLPASIGCGACGPCLSGMVNRCNNHVLPSYVQIQQCYGLSNALQGSQAQAVRVPVGDFNAHLIPDGVTMEQGVLLTDSAASAWYGCELANVQPGGSVGILGLGPIGLIAIEQCFVLGASVVFAIDPVPERRAVATTLGAIALSPEEAVASIQEATKGFMLDSVLEASGSGEALRQAFDLAGKARNIGMVGVNQVHAKVDKVLGRSAFAAADAARQAKNPGCCDRSGHLKPTDCK